MATTDTAGAAAQKSTENGQPLQVQGEKLQLLLKEEKPAIPAPLICDPEFCNVPAQCAMTFEPKVQGSLLDKISSPATLQKARATLEDQDNGQWHLQLFKSDQSAVESSRAQGFGYLDMKYILQGDKEAGPLEFRISSTKKHYMLFCQPPGNFGQMPEKCGTLAMDAEVRIDGQVMPLRGIQDKEFYNDHAIPSSTCFATQEKVDKGDHAIQVRSTNVDGLYITLSAIIWY